MRADSVYVCCQLTIVTYVVSGAWVGMTSFCAVPIVLFLMLRSICLNEIQLRDYWYLDNYCLNMSRFGPAPFQCTCNANNSAYTHTAIFPPPPFVLLHLGGPVPEDIIWDFKTCREDNRGKCANIRLNATLSGQAPNMRDCIRGGLVTWRLSA